MIYYTNKARETAREKIADLIPIVAQIPFDVVDRAKIQDIICYLKALDTELANEIKKNS